MKKKRQRSSSPKTKASSRPKRKISAASAKSSSKKSSKSSVSKKDLEVKSLRIRSAMAKLPPVLKLKKVRKPAAKLTNIEPLSYAVPMPAAPEVKDLPFSYNETKLVLLVRDPYWAYIYWDFSADTWNWIVSFRERDHGARPKLRVHNIDLNQCHDMDIFLDAKNWYLELGLPNTAFEVELGLVDSSGKFHRIALSNRIRTPRNGPSPNIDREWELSELELAEIYRLSGAGKTGHGSETFSSFRRR